VNDVLSPIRWEDGVLWLLDQLRLPTEERWVACRDDREVADAIRSMIVRGAPAIGCTAAFGVALAARRGAGLDEAIRRLGATRPTAVNLFWALEEMRRAARESGGDPDRLEARAIEIWHDDIERCRRMGRHGAALIPDGATVLTHCNAGALATGGYGTALGVIRGAREQGKRVRVLADETRPYLQGARLTAWELQKSGIDVTVVPDVAAAWLMKRGEVTCAIVGADRIAANGDTANKIGTYQVALAAREHGVPFYVAAPWSTVDPTRPNGDEIPIEERSSAEVTELAGRQLAPTGVPARNPAFDVTPARLIAAIVTETGVHRPPYLLDKKS
jgi:methylthioribose-1-phosphate isomerase